MEVVIVIILLLVASLLWMYKPEHKKKTVLFRECPIQGYWQRGNHIMLIGVNLNEKRIIISSTIGRIPRTQKGYIISSSPSKIIYRMDGETQEITYDGVNIKWMGLTYNNPELENRNVIM